jgi:hypothetical protein
VYVRIASSEVPMTTFPTGSVKLHQGIRDVWLVIASAITIRTAVTVSTIAHALLLVLQPLVTVISASLLALFAQVALVLLAPVARASRLTVSLGHELSELVSLTPAAVYVATTAGRAVRALGRRSARPLPKRRTTGPRSR